MMKLDNKLRITIIALIAAVPSYLALGYFMPLLPPQQLYGIAAFAGVVIGLVLNYLWVRLYREEDET